MINEGGQFKSVHDIEDWKASLLRHVVDAFACQNQSDIQKSISAWRWSEELPFPYEEIIRINGGSMTFEVSVADVKVFFSVWFTFGEIRIGVRVPNKLLNLSDEGVISERISRAYDGQPCQKITDAVDGRFFDWIFRDHLDGFASFSVGVRATQSRATQIAIASKLADVLTHLYMATLNILIEDAGLKVTIKQIKSPSSVKYLSVVIRGDKSAFEYWIKSTYHGSIEKVTHSSNGQSTYLISGDMLTVTSLTHGDHQLDGSWFSIMDIRQETPAAVVVEPALAAA